MKFLFDLFPVVCFFAVYWFSDIYVATVAAIAATFAQVAWLRLRGRRIEPMLWVSLALIVVFGGLTLVLQDKRFIMWKPTVLYWLFAAVLAVSATAFRRNLIRAMLEKELRVPDPVWARLNWSWVGFFAAMGGLNLYVAFSFEEATWVKFKLLGGIGLMLLFVLAQALVLARYVEEEPASGEER
ncbi:MAG TPA: septation protein A [Burkholderiales bacterium]|jgi:intracellular septation protein|nr:septation protein A [Burkholderiales bacterium]